MQSFFVTLGLMVIYGVVHSVMAALGFKGWVRRTLGEYEYHAFYRLFFNVFSVVTLLPILFYTVFFQGGMVWEVEEPFSYLILLIRLIGLAGVFAALLQIDWLRFLGVWQVLTWLDKDTLPLPEEPLQTGGVYGWTRHPLYFFSLVFLWATPRMSAAYLGFMVGTTLYFLVGSWVEERKLLTAFGKPYAEYQARVPWMIPFIK